jgi:flagellar motor switch/type III secretory pathway protein FliN
MTGLVQSTRAAEDWERGEGSSYTELIPATVPVSRGSRRMSWRGIGWFASGVAGSVAIAWFIVFSPGEIGSKAQWFFGAAVLCVVMASMWQLVTIQRLARRDAAEAAERHREELAAAEERAMRELAMTQRLHRTQMEAQQRMHHAEMETQRELAHVERSHLTKQLQKQAMIEVSRAVNAHTQLLATLWNQGAGILRIEDRDEREQAMNPIFEQISQVVNDFSVEIGNAHLLVEDDRVHRALNHVNEAVLMAIRVAEAVHDAVVEGHEPQPNPIPAVQQLMHTRAAEARRLAWDLVRAGLYDASAASE